MEDRDVQNKEAHSLAVGSSASMAALTLGVALTDCDVLLGQIQKLPPIMDKPALLARANALKRNLRTAHGILIRDRIHPPNN